MELPKETQSDLNVTKDSKIEFITPPIAQTNTREAKPEVVEVSESQIAPEQKPAVIVNPNFKNKMNIWMYIVPAIVMILVVIYILVF